MRIHLTFYLLSLQLRKVFTQVGYTTAFNLCRTSPKNSHGVRCRCAGTLTFNEGNIHGCTSWVCIHPYSVVKATSVAVHRGCALTHTLMKAIVYSLPCAVKPGTVSVKWGGAVTTHISIQTPAVGNPPEDSEDPHPPTHQTERCPLTLIQPLSATLLLA